MGSLPLRYRLPNPPAVFVGREREVAWLVEAVKRAPVTVVTGPGGLGKTALVLHALHRRFKRRAPKTVFVSLGTTLSAEELLPEVLRALAAAEGVGQVDWHALQGDPDAMLESLLDLAETSGRWVVLDDLHHGDPEEARWLLRQLSRYARDSKWIATSRMDPHLEDATQVVALGGMDDDELAGLARAWAKEAPSGELARAVRVSGGSPWLLQQCLATGRAEPASSRESLLAELPEDATRFLEALAAVQIQLPLEAVARWAPVPDAARLEALERRGLVEVTPAGLRLHDVVRAVLAEGGANGGAWAERAADALASSDDSEERLEALRLMLEGGRVEEGAQLLERDGTEMLAAGYAPRLWRLIEHAPDERLEPWRLRCVAELGNPTALGRVREPEHTGGSQGLPWARTLFMRGEIEAAGRLAGELHARARAEGDHPLAHEAGLLAARCLDLGGDPPRAQALLESLEHTGPEEAAMRDAELAQSRARTGDVEGAREVSERLRAAIPELAGEARDTAIFALAHTLCRVGQLAEADELSRTLQATPRGGAPKLFLARRAIKLRAEVALRRGDLDGAAAQLAQLEPFLRGASLWRPSVLCTQAAVRLAKGELGGLGATLTAAVREAESYGDAHTVARGRALACELDTLEGRRSERVPGAQGLLALRIAQQLAKNGERPDAELVGALGRGVAPDWMPLAHGVQARLSLSDGDAETALAHAVEAVRQASRSGHAVREAEARDLLCEVSCVLGRPHELGACAEELGRLAERMGSGRFAPAAELWRLAGADLPRWATLERLALLGASSPVVARRAQALLGGSPDTDVSDTLVLEGLRARPGWQPPVTVEAPEGARGWTPGWGLDERHHVAWLPDGRAVDFAKRNLHWRLLEVLADAGGHATKERLARDVWGETEYHPLRHDPRMHVAIRKLRELLEDDPSSPERVVTAEDGYALAGPLRRVPSDARAQ